MIKLRFVVKTCLLLVVLANAEDQLHLQEQEKRQRLRPTEFVVEETTRKLKFGDKKPKSKAHSINASQFQENAKYLNKSQSLLPQQQQKPFEHYEIPIVQKQRPSKADSYKGQRQNAPSYWNEKRFDAAVTSRNWSHNRAEEQLNATSLKLRQNNIAQRSSSGGLLTARPHSRKIAITTTTTTNPISTTTTTVRPSFLQQNPFNIFSPEFWRFSSPVTTKKPPKKYTPAASFNQSSIEKKVQNAKILSKTKVTTLPTTTTTTTTTTTKIPTTRTTTTTTTTTTKNDLVDDGPFRIALPTLNFFNTGQQQKTNPEKDKEKRAIIASLREKYNCPRESEVRFQLFPKICKTDADCFFWNREELCCDIFGSKSCASGVAKPLEEGLHEPILGLIQRKCPTRPLAELWWEVKECQTDMDCWPRVCCPDGRRRYCRTSQPELETAPVQVKRSFDFLTEYLECTPPPPPIFDLHPKACTSTFDCFPNVCCQEAGLRHCRPPKKSVLSLMANFLNVDLVKRFAQNIVIK